MRKSLRHWRGLVAVAASAAALATVIPTAQAAAPIDRPTAADVVADDVGAVLAEEGEVPVVVMLDGHRPGSDVARLRRTAAQLQDAVLGDAGTDLADVQRFGTVPAFTATVRSAEALERLTRRPEVRRIDTNDLEFEPLLAESVPFLGADRLHDVGLTGEGATVAVVDTGIDKTHPDLADSVVYEACFGGLTAICPPRYRWSSRMRLEAVGTDMAPDNHGHGTGVAGVITSDGVVAGAGMAPDADIVAIKVGEAPNHFPTPAEQASMVAAALAGLDHLAANPQLGVDVVNMSFGIHIPYEGDSCETVDANFMVAFAAIANLRAAGTLAVAAAGNDGNEDRIAGPGCFSNVLSVGATTEADEVKDYSDTGPGLDVLAPMWSDIPWPGGGTYEMGGTSSSSPMVAGCAALLSQMDADPGPDEITQAITSTGVPVARGAATYPRLDCRAAALSIDAGLGDGGDDGDDGDDEVVCVTAANTAHVSADRATAVWGYAFARGTADSLGRNRSTVTTSLRQIGTDRWELVSSC